MASRIILFPGLGADERMFENLSCPVLAIRHLVPDAKESLDEYARRTADMLEIDGSDIVGGSSFGSLVASAIARNRKVAGLVLIGGAISSAELVLPWFTRILGLMPKNLTLNFLHSERFFRKVFASEGAELQEVARQMMLKTPDDLLYYGGRMLMSYFPDEALACPVYAIHGEHDPIMRPPPVNGCRVIPDAGHAIAWTHGRDVSLLLENVLSDCTRE